MSVLVTIVVIAFAGAIFAIVPGGEIAQKLTLAMLAIVALVMQGRLSIPRRGLALIWPFLVYLLIAACSAYAHSASVTYTIAALQSLLLGLVIYLWAINQPLGESKLRSLRSVAYAVVITQFAFALIKLAVHGIDEKVLIGTMSHTAGQLGFLFPAIAIPILVFVMSRRNIGATFVLVAAMFIFGIINEKRSVIFVLPLILLASVAANYPEGRHKTWGLLLASLIGVLAAVLGSAVIPSLNPDSTYGGAPSILFAIAYAWEYLNMDFGGPLQGEYEDAAGDRSIQVGRIILWLSIVEWIRSADVWTLLFGTGFGTATPSIWLQEGTDTVFSLIGTRGGISGAGLAALETGAIGLLTIGYFFIHIFTALLSSHRRATTSIARRWLRTLMIVHFVFCYDFFFYSTVLLRTLPLPVIFFGLIASMTLLNRWEQKQLTRHQARMSPQYSGAST